jgi:hypothetical protein
MEHPKSIGDRSTLAIMLVLHAADLRLGVCYANDYAIGKVRIETGGA